MKRRVLLIFAALAALVALMLFTAVSCGGDSGGSGEAGPVPEDPPPVVDPPIEWPEMDPLASAREVNDTHFATSRVCALCHQNSDDATAMRDVGSRPVGPVDLWRSTAMANSARDPLWRAVVSAEIATNPGHAAAIEAKCTRCHAPMAHEARARLGLSMDTSLLQGDTDVAQLGLDGASCTLCHQVEDDGLGSEASYSGGFAIGDERRIYAGHADPNPNPMWRHTEFTPTYAEHTGTAAVCATCHTLETHAIDDAGQVTDHVLLEQGPYLEWRNSVFNDEVPVPGPDAASCQACHMPSVGEDGIAIRTQLAHNPSGIDFGPGAAPTRSPYHRHLFVGGNTFLPRLLRENADTLRPSASMAALETTEAAAREMLASKTAQLELRGSRREADALEIDLRVVNLAGHKFPSAYPSRRAWLRIRVRDAGGTVVFATGEHDDDGRLLRPDGAVLASESTGGSIEAHRDRIEAPDQVQVYESVMQDALGEPTWRLLRGAAYIKDNRLLPRGWDPEHAEAERAGPRGGAAADTDFVGGRDDVTVRLTAPAALGPYVLEVELLYQVLAPRFAAELFGVDTQEIAAFRAMYEATSHAPETVARLESALD